ncbi:anti-sigma factor [Virgibacillus siamensis]|uniref:anti-sigma factor n=1 Tax=Virgibacillus siamensis TaxID=480071 RepID=UPI0009870EA1|nr:anti-sigma factor [Virgibacillus siamensis]
MTKKCDQIVPYLNGELTKEERENFEDHLSQCQVCSAELKELQEAWSALPSEVEEASVPPELKSEVMDFVFTNGKTEPPQEDGSRTIYLKWKHNVKQHFKPLALSITAMLFIVVAVLIYQNIQLNQALSEYEKYADSSVKVIRTLELQSVIASSDAQGYAAVIESENGRTLVIHLNQLPMTEGEQAYQVWLLNDGKRKNAGTFRPAPNGKGMITFPMPDMDYTFGNIGITLEPDANGAKPRGKKVIGAS